MLRVLAFVVVGLSVLRSDLMAQDFYVYTRVFDLDSKEPNKPVANSRTVFHAGKIYDVIHGSAEATIVEPALHRIRILNSDKNLVSIVEFDELKHLLRSVEERMAQQIQELDGQPKVSRDLLDTLRFQLRPKFETQFDAQEHRLRLQSRTVSYEVTGIASDRPGVVEAYLTHTDWACRLNYVLHPQPLFPTVRLEVNEQLRQQKMLPVEVTLRAKLNQPLNLKAMHSLGWNLDAKDKQSIHQLELKLRDPKLQEVSLSEYQRITLSQQTAKNR